MPRGKTSTAVSGALKYVYLIGIVNLFADMTYEGARGEVGAFLHHLGASGTAVGLVAGGGEMIGYVIRSISGVIADRTGLYWLDAWIGYIINMLCVPALALVGSWPAAAGLVIGERLGRGIRRPVMSAVLAQAGREIGTGRAFGLNEALDQIGATLGPLIVAYAIARSTSFSFGFGRVDISGAGNAWNSGARIRSWPQSLAEKSGGRRAGVARLPSLLALRVRRGPVCSGIR